MNLLPFRLWNLRKRFPDDRRAVSDHSNAFLGRVRSARQHGYHHPTFRLWIFAGLVPFFDVIRHPSAYFPAIGFAHRIDEHALRKTAAEGFLEYAGELSFLADPFRLVREAGDGRGRRGALYVRRPGLALAVDDLAHFVLLAMCRVRLSRPAGAAINFCHD